MGFWKYVWHFITADPKREMEKEHRERMEKFHRLMNGYMDRHPERKDEILESMKRYTDPIRRKITKEELLEAHDLL